LVRTPGVLDKAGAVRLDAQSMIELATEIFERHDGRERDDCCRRWKLMLETRE
jgi:hypothetical protein